VVAEHIDTLVLGCTHYPLLKALFEDILGPGIHLVDSAEAIGGDRGPVADGKETRESPADPPQYHFFVTDVPYRFQTIGERFLGRTLSHVDLVKL